MKVYCAPAGLDAPKFDFKGEESYEKACEKNLDDLRNWLTVHGYTGKHSGKIARFGVADGYAQYMLAEAPRGSRLKEKNFLIHLAFWDGYHYDHVEYLPKKEIIENVKRQESLAKLFSNGSI